jgi:hypothetical protein
MLWYAGKTGIMRDRTAPMGHNVHFIVVATNRQPLQGNVIDLTKTMSKVGAAENIFGRSCPPWWIPS